MIRYISLILFIFTLSNVHAQEISYPSSNVSEFKLVIKGISKIEGEIRIAIFDSKEKYKKDPVHAVVLPVDSTTIIWENDALPKGNYAIAVYHDRNKNGKIDTNLLGIPKEDYGFSNNARGKFGPASWKDAVFIIDEAKYVAEITIK